MASRIPVAEMLVVPGGTHGTIIEEPRIVNRAVLDFLERHIGGGSGTVSLVERRARSTRNIKGKGTSHAEH
jgi:hypothetical protein